MGYFYTIAVIKGNYYVAFKTVNEDNYIIYRNEYKDIKKLLSTANILYGFKNYKVDDYLLVMLLNGKLNSINCKEIYNNAVNNKHIDVNKKAVTENLQTVDLSQDLPNNYTLEFLAASLGLEIPKEITDSTLGEQVETILKKRLDILEKIKEYRTDYLESKVDIIKTFNLKAIDIKKTQNKLAATILQASQENKPNKYEFDRLSMTFVDTADVPTEIVNFYQNIKEDWTKGISILTLESRKLVYKFGELEVNYGFGGLHGALSGFTYEGNLYYLDFDSFFPSIMINEKFLSRAITNSSDYEKLLEMKRNSVGKKREIAKTLINKVYGELKNQYSAFYDPLIGNNVTVAGQILITKVIVKILSLGFDIVQVNTDGLIFKGNGDLKDFTFDSRYKISKSICKKIYQRNVNNYAIVDSEDNIVHSTGLYKVDTKVNKKYFKSLEIIGKAMYEYYIKNVQFAVTINNMFKSNNYIYFQIVCNVNNSEDLYVQKGGEYIKLPNVVRIFAAKKGKSQLGAIYTYKNGKYEKYRNSPDSVIIFNEDMKNFYKEKNNIDLIYYINLCKKYMVENYNKKSNDFEGLDNVTLEDMQGRFINE